jgi:hypothetical protein
MKRAVLIYGGVAMLIVLPFGAGGGKQARASADPTPATAFPQVIKGEIVMLSTEVCVVRDATGKTVLFKIDKGTKIDKSVKEGKTVEVSASVDGLAFSIKEAS